MDHLKELSLLPVSIRKRVLKWLEGSYDESTKKEIESLLKKKPKVLEDAFSDELSFGTGGIRALMGVGTNRLNSYTVQKITQGLANYLKKENGKLPHRVAIGYDCRNNSALFASICARVLAANGIEAYLFDSLRPTPLLSFACIYHHCSAGVMITASHNPPEYNGFKVYGRDGGQILPPVAKKIEKEISKVDLEDIKIVGEKHSLIKKIGSRLDKIYIQTTLAMQTYPESNLANGKNLKIIYTSLHGAGISIVPSALKAWGFPSIHLVKKQCRMDGNFTHVQSPNPEEKAAFLLGAEDLLRKRADILLATDPDADRVGVVVRHENDAVYLSGNQIASLALYHLLEGKKHVHENTAFVKTIVTTELFREIAAHYQKPCFDVLTGFKFIGEKIALWEKTGKYHFLFGAEESIGYLVGTSVRDKDAVSASCLIAEMALHLKKEKKTLYDELLLLYQKFGVFREKLSTLSFPDSTKGKEKMEKIMQSLRLKPLKSLLKKKVILIEDYLEGVNDLPKSDVLSFRLEDQTKIVLRPSGTEPKMKIYLGVQARSKDVKKSIKDLDQYLDQLTSAFQEIYHAR